MKTAQEIFAKMPADHRCDLLDFAEDGIAMRFAWHDLGILDADADLRGGHYVDCSTLNDLGEEVVKLCQAWWNGLPRCSVCKPEGTWGDPMCGVCRGLGRMMEVH